jgi:hypothetical protein
MTGVEDFVRTERRGEGPGALAYLPQGARGVFEVATRQHGSTISAIAKPHGNGN